MNVNYAVNGDGTADVAAKSPGTAGAWNCLASATSAQLSPGDTVHLHAGIYNEPFWPKYGGVQNKPITFRSIGDGDVIIQQTKGVPVPQGTGLFYSPDSQSVGHQRNVNHLRVIGQPGSRFCFKGDGSADGLVVYTGPKRENGNDFTFAFVELSGFSSGGLINANDFRLYDTQTHHNGWSGIWFNQCNRVEIRRFLAYQNNLDGPNVNSDGLNFQDCTFVLVEDGEIFGQYDGLDLGSQKASPGVEFAIVRRVRAYDNSNTNFPNSSTSQGPITLMHCQTWGNRNWGAAVSYEGSRNIRYWNNVFVDVLRGINYIDPHPVQPLLIAKNNIFSLSSGNEAIRGSRGIIAEFNHVTPGVVYFGFSPGKGSTEGPVHFINKELHDYRITKADVSLIDRGDFFLRTTSMGVKTISIPVNDDPRGYFWPGDKIMLQGEGSVEVKNLTDTRIIVSHPLSFPAGAGVHLPWLGVAPDIGFHEFGTP